MFHTRDEVIERTIQEFEFLDNLVANLSDEDWNQLLHSVLLSFGIIIASDWCS